MKIRKLFPVLLLVGMFMASSAWAGNYPEFDAVGVDANNYFAKNNIAYKMVTEYFRANKVNGFSLEDYSYFTKDVMSKKGISYFEQFSGGSNPLRTDPCWKDFKSVLTTITRDGEYDWWIVLQMMPESDIDLNIYDCVLKWQGEDKTGLWGYAEQTGRFRADWGKLFFVPLSAPVVTVEAYPGPYALDSFKEQQTPQILEARKMPGLWRSCLDQKPYTSKAHWDESIVIALPETGCFNEKGYAQFQLAQGDIIHVKIEIPDTNMADIYYGADSVVLKYIGMSNTEFLDND